jgi:hypothetical protein
MSARLVTLSDVCREGAYAVLVAGVVFAQWVLLNAYHLTTDMHSLLLLIFGAVTSIALVPLALGAARASVYEVLTRGLVVALFVWALYELVLARMPYLKTSLGPLFWPGLVVVTGALVVLAGLLSHSVWEKARSAGVAGLWVFFASGPVLGWWFAQPLNLAATPAEETPRYAAVAVVVLDEFSASASTNLVEQLRLAGFHVQSRAVAPAGSTTAQVIPALLTGRPFDNAIACGATTICSTNTSLDFSQIQLMRSDVDMIGFFHPYCAIKGTRSCTFVPYPDSGMRWTCRIARRAGDLAATEIRRCQELARDQWAQMTQQVVDGLWSAPFWQRGGLLYAHVPLPHPPGDGPARSLGEDYARNILKAEALVLDMAARMQRQQGKDFRLIVTSDHPLRPQLWCLHYLYRYSGCHVDATHVDTQVPVIVVSGRPVAPIEMQSNQRVLELAGLLTSNAAVP